MALQYIKESYSLDKTSVNSSEGEAYRFKVFRRICALSLKLESSVWLKLVVFYWWGSRDIKHFDISFRRVFSYYLLRTELVKTGENKS